VSLKKRFSKDKLDLKKISNNHKNEFKNLKPSFEMEISTKDNNSFFCAYEVFYKLPSLFTIVSKSKVSIIMLASNELFNILSSDDINIIKKNILKPFSDIELINFYLEHRHWERFKKKVILSELKHAGKISLIKGFTHGQKTQSTNFVKEMEYFRERGTFKIECKSIYFPRIIGSNSNNES